MRINYEKDTCRGCGDNKWIVYKEGHLCDECNKKRKTSIYLERGKGKPKFNKKAVKQMRDDVSMYMEVWEAKPPFCEECATFLGDYTAEEAARWHKEFFSHILPKGLYGRIRHVLKNFNLLCFDCHNKWENRATQKLMKIWTKNKKVIIELLKEYGYAG